MGTAEPEATDLATEISPYQKAFSFMNFGKPEVPLSKKFDEHKGLVCGDRNINL